MTDCSGIIDVHVHLYSGDGFDRKLIETARRLNYRRLVLHGIEAFFPEIAGNRQVLDLAERHPDLIVPFAHFQLGNDLPSRIASFRAEGFRGCKFIAPPRNYDDSSYRSVYEALEAEGMVAFFHTGEIGRSSRISGPSDVSATRMRPGFLETIARWCPNLTIVGAHLGHEAWYDEALAVARLNPNVFFDLASLIVYTRTPAELARMLWWKDPVLGDKTPIRKLLFGSDCHPELKLIGEHLERIKSHFCQMGAAEELDNILFHNAAMALSDVLGITASQPASLSE
jgi:predicted TIM-barrel fold metal-dependent hydrolase